MSGEYADLEYLHVASVAEALEINTKAKWTGGNNIAYDIRHWDQGKPGYPGDQRYTVDGKEYRVWPPFFLSGER